MRRPAFAILVVVLTGLGVSSGCGGEGGPASTDTGGRGVAATATGAAGDDTAADTADRAGTDPSPNAVQAPGTYGVGLMELTYVDATRSTAAHGGRPEIPSRTLRTVVLYPSSEDSSGSSNSPVTGAPGIRGPWPTIIFAHGSTRKAEDYLATLSRWASAGYVVVAPNFPLSTEGVPGGTLYSDYPSQSADVSFLIDAISTDHRTPLSPADLVDLDRLGMGGQSFGAITTLGTVAAECCADARIVAATEFAGMFLPYPSGDELSEHASSVPVLFFHGDDDPTVPYAADHGFWKRLGAPGGFVTITGGGHDDGYFGGANDPLDELVADVALAFYDLHLKDDTAAAQRMTRLLEDAGPDMATFEAS